MNVTQLDTSLADLAPLTSYQYQLVSAIAQIPVTKLFKNVPTGLQSTGEYEWDDYAQTIRDIQVRDYTPLLRKHFELYCASFYPERKDLKLDIEWKPIDVPKEKEQVQMASQLSNSIGSLCSQGIIEVREARNMLRSTSNPMFQYISAKVPELLEKIEEQKDPEKAMEMQMKMQQMQQMQQMPPGGGMPPMPGMPDMGDGAQYSQEQGGGEQQQDPSIKENEHLFQEALSSVVGEEATKKFLETGEKPDLSKIAQQSNE